MHRSPPRHRQVVAGVRHLCGAGGAHPPAGAGGGCGVVRAQGLKGEGPGVQLAGSWCSMQMGLLRQLGAAAEGVSSFVCKDEGPGGLESQLTVLLTCRDSSSTAVLPACCCFDSSSPAACLPPLRQHLCSPHFLHLFVFASWQSGWVEITLSSGDPMRPHKVSFGLMCRCWLALHCKMLVLPCNPLLLLLLPLLLLLLALLLTLRAVSLGVLAHAGSCCPL